MALWLYLQFPTLQLDCLYSATNGGLYERAIVIVDGKQNEVVQLNQAASQEGIHVGMGLGAAAALCAQLEVLPYEEKIETKKLKQLARWLYLVTADIALFPPNGLLLQVTNMLTLHQNLGQFWQAVRAHLQAFPVNYAYATGFSPYAARLLARRGINRITDDKTWLDKQLKRQELTHGDLTFKNIEQLQKVGVHYFADLLSLSLVDLSKRFDVEVVNYIGRLTGTIDHKLQFYIPPETFEHSLDLYYEVSNLQYLEKPLLKLYNLLETHFQLRDKLAGEIKIVLTQRDADDLSIVVAAAQGEYKAVNWWRLTQLRLESIRLTKPVVAITVKVTRIRNKFAERQDLFQGSQGQLSESELVAILTAKLGEHKVKGIKVQADHRPEFANVLTKPLINPSVSLRGELNQDLPTPLRPSILLPVPQKLSEKVSLQPYPERVISGWWDDQEIIRDYFIARSDSGRWLWVFRDPSQRWFLHGIFC